MTDKLVVTYTVNDTVLHDHLEGANGVSSQLWDTGRALVLFPERDGVLRSQPGGDAVFTNIRALHYGAASRIVKMRDPL